MPPMTQPLAFSIALLLTTVLLSGCSTQPVAFQLVQTHELPLEETDTITVNNCGNILARPYFHWYSDDASVGVSNLKPNGGEPFTSIRHRMAEVYGKSVQPFFYLRVPPNTHRLYTFNAETVRYRGEVTGEVITVNKEHPATPTFYSYALRRTVELVEEVDFPCP